MAPVGAERETLYSNCCSTNGFLFQTPTENETYKLFSKKDRTFAIKTLFYILSTVPFKVVPLHWRYTLPNVSSIVGMLPGTHFL
jgi:hypothetical protein